MDAPAAWRQSYIARFDACPLSLRFDLESGQRQLAGYMGAAGATGVLAHRAFARIVEHLHLHSEESMGVDMAMEILAEVTAQRDVPGDEVVHLRMRDLRWLRGLVTRFVCRQSFTVDRVVAVERRLEAEIEVRGPDGTTYRRTITGRPDLLLAGPGEAEATVLDWKTGWAPPARRREPTVENPAPEDRLSDMGYVQQVVYGWLVLRNYPAIERVTEREHYVRQDEDPVREASVERWQVEQIEDVLSARVSAMDAAVEEGGARWFPVPGSHCAACPGVRHCPIRLELGIPETLEDAQRLGREWIVAGEVRKERTPFLKGWVEHHGPVPIAHAKGRRVIGFRDGSRSLSLFEPEGAAQSPFDPLLERAARDAGMLDE